MTDVILLREYIQKRGVKHSFIAEKIGLSPQSFSMKLDNGSDFKAWQMFVIKDILNLSDDEAKSIFFANKVD